LSSYWIDYGWTKSSISAGTSPALGGDSGGNAFGSNGWFPGGGAFYSYSMSPELTFGVALDRQFRRRDVEQGMPPPGRCRHP